MMRGNTQNRAAHLRSRQPRRRWSVALMALAPLLLAACAPGTYQVELFPEQHYQQSYKRQEPPRLTPPDGAVPVNGRETAIGAAAANLLKSPVTATTENLAHGAEVYRVNCAMCHGPKGGGDGAVGDKLAASGYVKPPNLIAPATQNKSDGALFFTITNGVVVMPKFGLLLNEHDRWTAVAYLRYLAQPGQQAAPQTPQATPTPKPGGH